MRRFFAGFLAGIAATCLFFAGIGHVLDVEDPLRPADVIVALSGDTGARTETAVDLWRRAYAPLIIFSGASEDPNSAPSGELMKRQALALGVPEAAILVEPSSSTTQENAHEVANLMKARGLKAAILVTSPYHQRRAANLFAEEFGPAKLTFTNYPARDPQWDPNTWWLREPSRTLTVVELAKLSVEVASSALH
ncbi:MAG TPA: YdcF family protein [Candidatus Limnocylindria bacterium]|nr:YdcF family protein [Candidatus Limnocylindria bacterium]